MNKLLELSVRTRLFAFVVAAGLAVWGAYAYQHLTIEAFPDPTDTQVQVITQYSGQPTEEVERRVSTPIERELTKRCACPSSSACCACRTPRQIRSS